MLFLTGAGPGHAVPSSGGGGGHGGYGGHFKETANAKYGWSYGTDGGVQLIGGSTGKEEFL